MPVSPDIPNNTMRNPQTEAQIDFENECIDEVLDQIEAEERQALANKRVKKAMIILGFEKDSPEAVSELNKAKGEKI